MKIFLLLLNQILNFNFSLGKVKRSLLFLLFALVTVVSGYGQSEDDFASATITVETNLAASFDVVNVDCYGNSSGSIDLTVSGGLAPFTYAWNTEETTEDITDLPKGTYTVIITDARGCSISDSVTISEPDNALEATTEVFDVLCYGDGNGSINLNVSGGTQPYIFNWSNGAITKDLTSLNGGEYTATITDANGCEIVKTITVFEPDMQLATKIVISDVLCYGENNGEIDISTSGGTAPYTYSWGNGASTEDLFGLTAGIYTVTVTDANLCEITEVIEVLEPSKALSASANTTNLLCFGDSMGSIDLTVSGGTEPYSYSWDNDLNTEDIEGLSAGSYDVVITDFNGCSITETFVISEPDALSVTSTIEDVLCFDESTGAIDLTVAGGTAPYTYSWDNGSATEDIADLSAGSYEVIITDSNGCNLAENFEISEPATGLSATASTTDVLCFDESTGSIDLTISGGTAPYTYDWDNGSSTKDIADLTAGNYEVVITDSNGCSLTENFEISQPVAGLSATASTTDVLCFGDSTGSIDLTISGGTAPYTYNWGNGITTEDIAGLAAGSYEVIITDSYGCSLTENFEISEPAAGLSATAGTTDVLCFGESTGVIDLTVAGGTAPYTYVWNNSETSEDLSGLVAGVYAITVTDAGGCTFTDSITISEPDSALELEVSFINATASGNCSNGEATANVSGGTGIYTYLWSASTGNQTTVTAIDLPEGEHSVIITDGNGCEITEAIIIGCSTPKIDIVKLGEFNDENGDGLAQVDETISYTFLVTNQGNVPLNEVIVNDDLVGGIISGPISGDDNSNGILDLDETWTYNAQYLISQIDIDNGFVSNQALAKGEAPNGDEVEDESGGDIGNDDTTITELPGEGAIGLIKSGTFNDINGDGFAQVGETVTYTFTVTNTGNVVITGTVITDATIGVSGLEVLPNELLPGEVGTATVVYTLNQEDIDTGSITNTAIATGQDPDGNDVSDVSDDDTNVEDDPTITDLPSNISFSIEKSAVFNDEDGNNIPEVGETITYTFRVINTGNVKIYDILVEDPLIEVEGGPIDLEAGQEDSTTFFAIYTITAANIEEGSVINQATVSVVDSQGNIIEDLSDDPDDLTNVDANGDGEPDDPTVILFQGVLQIEDIVIHNVMTPNGDGRNDIFMIQNIEKFPKNNVQVFNRWGVEVYSTKGYNPMNDNVFRGFSDGRTTVRRGERLPTGTYYYVVSYERETGEVRKLAGFLYIN